MVESDIDDVMEIAASLPTAPQWSRAAYEVAVSAEEGAKRIALAAEHCQELIGFAIARVFASMAEIETIAIDKQAQGLGFGSSLLLAILGELRLAGVREVELEVRPSNEGALWIYRRAGFGEVGVRPGYYRNPDEDAVLLRLTM
jgi:ribosomal-protein-alanine N-acetyltransferase